MWALPCTILWLREINISILHIPILNSPTGQTRSCLPNELETYGNSENNRGAGCYFHKLRGLNTSWLMSEIMWIFQIKRKWDIAVFVYNATISWLPRLGALIGVK